MLSRVSMLLVLAGLSAGCRPAPIVVEGHEVDARRWELSQEQIRNRARFDLECQDLTLTLLNSEARTYPRDVGVEGCGKRMVYTMIGGSWIPTGPGAGAGPSAADAQQQVQRARDAARHQWRMQQQSQ